MRRTGRGGARTQPAPATERFFRDALGVSIDEFLQNISGQRAYGPHPSAPRLQAAGLVAMADIDYMLNSPRFRGPRVEPIRGGGGIATRRTTRAGERADAAYIYRQFATGASLRFFSVQRFLPGLSRFAAELAAALAQPVRATIYLAPANGGGLGRHFDDIDVFVLQCLGSKRWRLYVDDYANGRERPTGVAYAFDPKRHRPGPVDRDVQMTPGDILYLPRGVIHEVSPPKGDSLHVTFSVRTLTVAELLHRAVDLASAEVEGLQASVPMPLRRCAAVDDQFAAELAAKVAPALSSRHLAAALEGYRREGRQKASLAAAEHWFGSHQRAAPLGSALAETGSRRRAQRSGGHPAEAPTQAPGLGRFPASL